MAKTAALKPVARGIAYWMERVVAEREKASGSLNSDAVHDLRVALRRCRSMAEGFQSLNGNSGWDKVRNAGKVVFRALGDLRDAQVQLEWIDRLRSECPAVAERLAIYCQGREAELKLRAAEVMDQFDTQRWLQWAQGLDELVQRAGIPKDAFQVLALERYEGARQFHRRALRNRSKTALHELRIGIKRLRYIVENFLPEQDQAWGKDLRNIQDLLGEVHDLDVLWGTACQIGSFASSQERQQWNAAISRERMQRVQAYREKMLGRNSLWQEWRNQLPAGERLRSAVLQRFECWATSLDPDPAHTQLVTQFSLQIYDALQGNALVPARGAGEVSPRDLLHVAVLTHGVGHSGHKAEHKLSGRLLRRLELPPGWSATDMTMAALVARYHRGNSPTSQQRYISLSGEEQHSVDCLGGILRFADSLDSRHAHTIRSITVRSGAGRIDILADGYTPRSKQAERIAAARHVLENAIGTALLVRQTSEIPEAGNQRPSKASRPSGSNGLLA